MESDSDVSTDSACHTLDMGEETDLDTRVDGGPMIRRDRLSEDTYHINGNADIISRGEIKQLAELAGLDVSETTE